MAYRNGFRSKYACEFSVKPIVDCSTEVADFSCLLYFQQNGHTQDFIYVNPGISLLKPQVRRIETQGNYSKNIPTVPVNCTFSRVNYCFIDHPYEDENFSLIFTDVS